MRVLDNHRLDGVDWRPSPHFEPRPAGVAPELIVLHCVSLPENEFGTGAPMRLFQGQLDVTEHPTFADLQGLRVSPHVFIDRTGHVNQLVSFDHQAWHAGLSSWRHRPGCNPYSIGIELEGSVHQGYAEAQYVNLLHCLRALLAFYPNLSVERVVGHADIAPGRKQDPGPHFDWLRVLQGLSQLSGE